MSSPFIAPPTLARARDRLTRRHAAGVLRRHHLLIIVIAIVIAIIALLLPRTGHAAVGTQAAPSPAAATAGKCPTALDFRVKRLQDDAPQDLCQYAGRVVLVVNTASYCGYTYQYEGLEALYAKYRDKGLTVLGFLQRLRAGAGLRQADRQLLLQHLRREVPDVLEDVGGGGGGIAALPLADPADRAAAQVEFPQVPAGPQRPRGGGVSEPDRAE